MKQQRVDTGWAWAKKLNIPAVAKLGDTEYLSGICSLDDAGNVVAKGDVYGQSKRTFANIEEALASAGATMADVVKITTYLTDISTYADFAKARTEAFPGGVPASTAVATPALVMPELLVEVAGTGRIRYVEWPEDSRAIDIGGFYADSSKFQRAVGWKGNIDLREGLTRTVQYYRDHLAHYVDASPDNS